MENLLVLLAPVVVSLLSSGLKKLGKVSLKKGLGKKSLRLGVAVLSFGGAVGTAYLSGVEVDTLSVETFVSAVFVFLSSTGLYFFAKK